MTENRALRELTGEGIQTRLAGVATFVRDFIPQVAAAAQTSENKSLAQPASADSLPTSANQEDWRQYGYLCGLSFTGYGELNSLSTGR